MLKVIGTCDAGNLPDIVEIDYYVPISFDSYEYTLGDICYIRMVDPVNLVEFRIHGLSHVIRGVSAILVKNRSPVALERHGVISAEKGLPIIEMPPDELFSGPEGFKIMDIPSDCSIFLGEDFADIILSAEIKYDKAIVYGRTSFLTMEDYIVGVRIDSLTLDESNCLRDYMKRMEL